METDKRLKKRKQSKTETSCSECAVDYTECITNELEVKRFKYSLDECSNIGNETSDCTDGFPNLTEDLKLRPGFGFKRKTRTSRCQDAGTGTHQRSVSVLAPKAPSASVSKRNNDLDMDSLVADDVTVKVIEEPYTVAKRASQTAAGKKKRYPDQEDELYICHQRQTDSPLGDLFGAKIETWNCDKYYRHCFTGVKKNTPAAAMKLQDGDELVLINGVFAQRLTHVELLNMFHHLEVGPWAHLDFVIRRYSQLWIEVGATLSPDFKQYSAETKSKTKGESQEFVYTVMLSIDGTGQYVSIDSSGIQAITNEGDSRVILKRTCFLEDRGPGEFYYQVALSDERQIWNLNIKQDGSVCTTQEVCKLQEKRIGAKCNFIKNGFCLFYDDNSKNWSTSREDPLQFCSRPGVEFKEHPLGNLDTIDGPCYRTQNSDSGIEGDLDTSFESSDWSNTSFDTKTPTTPLKNLKF